ncbi:MAG: tRNA pseudouridine(38-40) synthase TruA [Rhodobacteraceae bacterium]|nr:tRNA pseudouridine(38-40) synthase TruA [Paracoccaceae bacterium]
MIVSTHRYVLLIEYDGAGYHGWQRQKNARTIQSCLEDALLSLCGQDITVHGSGRTDTGVHAEGQVAHFDLEHRWEPRRLAHAMNAHLRPERIAVLCVTSASQTFHARYAAIERTYRYRLVVRPAPLALEVNRAWRIAGPMHVDRIRAAGRHLLGRHDFTTFRSVHCQSRSPIRTLDSIDVNAWEDGRGLHINLVFTARSFLHRQVRSLVGSLVKVGQGSWSPERIADALKACDRSQCGPVAPAAGLTLMRVCYPDDPFKSVAASIRGAGHDS